MNTVWDHRQHASRTHGTHGSRSRTGRVVAWLRTHIPARARRCAACRAPDPAVDGFCCEACRQDWADSIAY